MNHCMLTETKSEARGERVQYLLPEVNIHQTPQGYTLEADMPGVNRESLEIYLDKNELTLVGRKSLDTPETTHYRESSTNGYRRVFELDPGIDTDQITARVENGVLTLHLARREELKPRKIAVTD